MRIPAFNNALFTAVTAKREGIGVLSSSINLSLNIRILWPDFTFSTAISEIFFKDFSKSLLKEISIVVD